MRVSQEGWPTRKEYETLLANDNFRHSRLGSIISLERNEAGGPSRWARGYNAVVTRCSATAPWTTTQSWQDGSLALRCFFNDALDRLELRRRYHELGHWVASLHRDGSPLAASFPRMQWIDDAGFYDSPKTLDPGTPVLLMDWVAADPLEHFVENNLADSERLQRAAASVRELGRRLKGIFAHGDVQTSNLFVSKSAEMIFVDFDSSYIPTLADLEVEPLPGGTSWQPPQGRRYGAVMDEFSYAVLEVSLEALGENPALWQKYHLRNRNLILRMEDFVHPERSPLLGELVNSPDAFVSGGAARILHLLGRGARS